jgi:hypothetical protein
MLVGEQVDDAGVKGLVRIEVCARIRDGASFAELREQRAQALIEALRRRQRNRAAAVPEPGGARL